MTDYLAKITIIIILEETSKLLSHWNSPSSDVGRMFNDWVWSRN